MKYNRVALVLAAIGLTACSTIPQRTATPGVEASPTATSKPTASPSQLLNGQAEATPSVATATRAPISTSQATQPIVMPMATEPPPYTPAIPGITLSQCIATAARDPSKLIGLWMRWYGPGEKTRYELLYFRDDHVVSAWLGGGIEGIGNIEPWIEDGTYTHTNDRHIELTIPSTAYASLDYGVCNDLLAVYNALDPSVGVYGYVRIPEMCWEFGDAYADRCFFRLDL